MNFDSQPNLSSVGNASRGLRKQICSAYQLLLSMRRRDLNTDTRFSNGYNRVGEGNDIHASFEKVLGHARGTNSIANHDRDYRVLAGNNGEAEICHPLPEKRGVFMQSLRQFLRGLKNLQSGDRGRNYRRRKRV